MKNKKGFTLVELIVVIVILGILAVIAVPAYNSYTQKAKDNKLKTDVAAAYSIAYAGAVENFSTDEADPANGTSGKATVECTAIQSPACEITAPEDAIAKWKLENGEVLPK